MNTLKNKGFQGMKVELCHYMENLQLLGIVVVV